MHPILSDAYIYIILDNHFAGWRCIRLIKLRRHTPKERYVNHKSSCDQICAFLRTLFWSNAYPHYIHYRNIRGLGHQHHKQIRRQGPRSIATMLVNCSWRCCSVDSWSLSSLLKLVELVSSKSALDRHADSRRDPKTSWAVAGPICSPGPATGQRKLVEPCSTASGQGPAWLVWSRWPVRTIDHPAAESPEGLSSWCWSF